MKEISIHILKLTQKVILKFIKDFYSKFYNLDYEEINQRNQTKKILYANSQQSLVSFNKVQVPMASVQLKRSQNFPKKPNFNRKTNNGTNRLIASQEFNRPIGLSEPKSRSLFSDMKERLDKSNHKIMELEQENIRYL